MSDASNSKDTPFQQHDTVFKWLIGKYPDDFFLIFFSHRKAHHLRNLDKEFIQKLEQKKAPVEADLLMAMEIEVGGSDEEVVVVLELKSKRADIKEQICTYCLHAVATFGKPVWAIGLYTDDEEWDCPGFEKVPLFYSSQEGFSYLVIDLIKLRAYAAEKLIDQATLLGKLMALKANDSKISREQLVTQIYEAAKESGTQDQEELMLVERFVQQYSNLSARKVIQIKEKAGMTAVASTITEFYIQEGKREGKREGLVEGKREGLVEGKREGLVEGVLKGKREGEILGRIRSYEEIYAEGLIDKDVYLARINQLQQQLYDLRSGSE